MEEQTAEPPVAVEKPVEIPAAAADVVKPAEIPAAEIPAVDDGTEKVGRAELESLKRDAASFRVTLTTEAKLKAKYAKAEYLMTSPRCRGFEPGMLKELLPETENAQEMDRVVQIIAKGYSYWKSSGAFANVGGSAGGNPVGHVSNSGRSAGELLGMRR